jgi:hypothetical protein
MADTKNENIPIAKVVPPILGHQSGTGGQRLTGIAVVSVFVLALIAAFLSTRISFGSFTAFVIVILALVGAYRSPRIALFIFIFYTSSVIAPEYLGFYIDVNLVYWGAELFLLVIIVGAIVERVREGPGAFHDFYTSPIALALTVLGAVISAKSIAFLFDVRFASWAINHVYTFNRSLGFLALFIPVFLLFNTGHRQRVFLTFIYVMGVFIALRVILEAVYPDFWIFEWTALRQPLNVDFPSVDPSILRLRAPGGSFVQVCFWMGMMNMILRPWNPHRLALYLPLTLLMITAILLEFNRSYVIPILVLIVLAMLLNRRAVRLKIASLVAVFTIVIVVVSLSTGAVSGYLGAFAERYSSAFSSETFETQSLNSRTIEDEYAWDSINREPVFGIGIDELYRPSVAGMLDNLRWYIHNAYLWYWVYFGFIGLAALLVAISVAVVRGMLNWKKISDPFLQAGVIALVFTLLTLSIASFYAPRFYEYGTVPVVAVIIGLIEAIVVTDRKARAQTEAQAEAEAEAADPFVYPAGDRSADE